MPEEGLIMDGDLVSQLREDFNEEAETAAVAHEVFSPAPPTPTGFALRVVA